MVACRQAQAQAQATGILETCAKVILKGRKALMSRYMRILNAPRSAVRTWDNLGPRRDGLLYAARHAHVSLSLNLPRYTEDGSAKRPERSSPYRSQAPLKAPSLSLSCHCHVTVSTESAVPLALSSFPFPCALRMQAISNLFSYPPMI